MEKIKGEINKMLQWERNVKSVFLKSPHRPNINNFSQTENASAEKQTNDTADAHNEIQSCECNIAYQSNRGPVCNFNLNG